MDKKWEKRFENLRLLGWLVLVGLPLVVAACVTSGATQIFCGVAGLLFVLPGFIYFYVLVILHWMTVTVGSTATYGEFSS